jgi:transglutaminase-like putative cysteine protease
MRLHIEHSTSYIYDRPVRFGRHRLVLRPREGHELRLERMALRLEPAHEVMWIRDIFGNSIALVDWLEPSNVLTIISDVIVERLTPFPEHGLHEPWRVPFPPRYEPLETSITDVYRSLTYPEDAARVQAWLRQAFVGIPDDAEGTMQALCALVFRTIKYQRRSERGVQNAARTLDLGTGSCRDMATLMMEAARLLGVADAGIGQFHRRARRLQDVTGDGQDRGTDVARDAGAGSALERQGHCGFLAAVPMIFRIET